MKTIEVAGVRKAVTFKTKTGVNTSCTYMNRLSLIGCDIYDIADDDGKALVLTSGNSGSDYTNSATYVTAEEYDSLTDLYDAYDKIKFHRACVAKCGAESI